VKNFIWILIFGCVVALAGPSSNRTTVTDYIKTLGGSRAIWTVPNGGNDTFAGLATTQTLTNKSMNFANNTFTNFDLTSVTGFINQLPVGLGGTGINTGTSGGIPYFNSTSTMASSGALTANQVVIGGGAGATPTVLAAGAQYAPLVMGASSPSYTALTLSQSAAVTGVLPIANGGTNNSSVAVTNGGVVTTDGSKLINMGAGTAGQIILAGTPPTWGNNTMTHQILTATGSTTGYAFTLTTTPTVGIGCVFSNNSVNFTVVSAMTGSTSVMYTTTAGGAPTTTGTLTYVSGGAGCNGAANLACAGANCSTGSVAMASYTTPTNARLLKVVTIGGGAGGGSVTSVAVKAGAGGGGGAGGTAIKYISSPVATYLYTIGAAGSAGTSGSAGGNGTNSYFVAASGSTVVLIGGAGQASSNACGAASVLCEDLSGGVSTASGGDFNFPGNQGGMAVVLNGTALTCAGAGGESVLGPRATTNCGANATGVAGRGYGGGGSGGLNINGGAAQNGGAGATGIVWVEEYY
jgi:hypothetical protein